MRILNNLAGLKANRIFRIRPSFLVNIVIFASFAYLLSVTWLKCGDLIIDTSRELWVPYKILKGTVLYKDIFYLFGFFVPYFISFLYKFFSVNLYVLIGLGIATTILMSIVIYKICRFFMDEITSGLAVLNFLFVFAFGFYTYNNIFNFILPYSFSSTIFILFISFALYFFIKFILSEKEKYLFAWSIFLALAFFCRPEFSFLTWIGFALIAAIIIIKGKHKDFLKIILYILLPLVIALLGYLIFLWKHSAFAGFRESMIDTIKFEIFNSAVTQKRAGVDAILENSRLMVCSLLFHLVIISLLAVGSSLISSYQLNKKRINICLGFIILLLAFAAAHTVFQTAPSIFTNIQYRCIPIILVIGISLFFIRAIRNPFSSQENLSLLTLFIISFLIIIRILLKTNPDNYGFYLLGMGMVCYFIFFMKIFKSFITKRIKGPKELFHILLIIFFIFLMVPYWQVSSRLYKSKNLKVIISRGEIICWPDSRTVTFWEAVGYLIKNTAKDDNVVVFPEGVSMNFFADRVNPLKYYHFLPFDIERIGEDKIVSQLIDRNVKYIIIDNRLTYEYGQPWFGVHYGKKISSWIYNNYSIVKEFGPRPFTGAKESGVVILQRNIRQ